MKVKELRERADILLRGASQMKCDIRDTFFSDEEVIDKSNKLAEKIDDALSFILDGEEYRDRYTDYTRWSKLHRFNDVEMHKSTLFFKPGDSSADRREEGGKLKRYHNYCCEHVIKIHHFVMCLEFNELYLQCINIKE